MGNSFSKRDISILIGNALDHFDTAIYGFLAPILAKLFFPSHDPIVGLILTYSIFASSLVTRPLGSYLFGIIVRKYGDIYGLSHSLIGVAISTILIGIIPTYRQIGWVAPLLLTIFKMLQGIYASGEITIAQLYLLENKLPNQAFKASYLYQTSTMLGIILASFISMFVINTEFHQYWRLCFIFGGITAFIGYFLRGITYKKDILFESNNFIFKTAIQTVLLDLRLIWKNKLNILRISFVMGFCYMTYIIPFVFMNSFIPFITNISIENMMEYNTILLVFDMIMIPIIGCIMARFSFKKVMNFAVIIMGLTVPVLCIFLNDSNILYVNLVRVWIILIGIIFLCPLNCWLDSLFTGSSRYMLVGVGSNIGASLIGHLTPTVCLMLWHFTNNLLPIAIYIAIISIATLWAVRN